MMTFSFDTRWDQALLTAIEIPTEMVLEGLYKIAGFCSATDCIVAPYEQENVRRN